MGTAVECFSQILSQSTNILMHVIHIILVMFVSFFSKLQTLHCDVEEGKVCCLCVHISAIFCHFSHFCHNCFVQEGETIPQSIAQNFKDLNEWMRVGILHLMPLGGTATHRLGSCELQRTLGKWNSPK